MKCDICNKENNNDYRYCSIGLRTRKEWIKHILLDSSSIYDANIFLSKEEHITKEDIEKLKNIKMKCVICSRVQDLYYCSFNGRTRKEWIKHILKAFVDVSTANMYLAKDNIKLITKEEIEKLRLLE